MDEKLINAINQMAQGKEEGFNAVYAATRNRVYFRAKKIMNNEEDALDLVQTVFIEAYRNIGSLQSAQALYSWLDAITYRQGMKFYRKNRDVLLTEEKEGMFEELESNDISSMPELTADQKATAQIVMEIIDELQPEKRVPVIAYFYDGMKIEQIAQLMDCPEGTIKSRLNNAKKYIRKRVEEREKAEGYRIHVVGLPVLWFSIKMLSGNTVLSEQTAQRIYNQSCSAVGIQATALSASGAAIAATEAGTASSVMATEAGTASSVMAAETGATSSVMATEAGISGAAAGASAAGASGTTATAATLAAGAAASGTTGTAAAGAGIGLGAKLAALGIGAKAAIATVSVAAAAVAATGVVAVTSPEKKEETTSTAAVTEEVSESENQTVSEEELLEGSAALEQTGDSEKTEGTDAAPSEGTEEEGMTGEETTEKGTEEVLPEEQEQLTELTAATQHQISSFIASYMNFGGDSYGSLQSDGAQGGMYTIFNYISQCKAFGPNYDDTFHGDELPFDWAEGYENIQREEFKMLFESGWGIAVPDNFSYAVGDPDYGLKIGDAGMEINLDGSLYLAAGGDVQITGYEDGVYTLEGTFSNGASDDDPQLVEKHFTATAIDSGNPEVYEGLQITGFQVQ